MGHTRVIKDLKDLDSFLMQLVVHKQNPSIAQHDRLMFARKMDPSFKRTVIIAVYHIYTIILLKSVGVRKLQVAILARSSRDISLTVHIV